jgi:PAS domain S-box-containing protein
MARRTTRPARNRSQPDADGAAMNRAALDLLTKARLVAAQTQQLRDQASALTQSERRLRDAHEQFSRAYDFVPVPYFLLSATGIILRVNESALDLFGVERPWIVGRPFVAYLQSRSVRPVLEQILACRSGQTMAAEADVRTAGGMKPAHLSVRREDGGSERRTVYHLSMVDLSELHRLQEERRQADEDRQRSVEAERVARAASDAKDEFLAMLSHELRTPLTPILAAADTLISHASLPSEVRTAIEIIRRNVKAEAHLIDDLLDVARINRSTFAVERRRTDVHHLLFELEQGWKAPLDDRDISLSVEAAAENHWIEGDPPRLAQVLRNLVNNAAKFTEPGGRITVTTDNQAPGTISLVVADNGIGIAPETLHKLFSPFVRTADGLTRGGLGLGLVICKGIVEAHGGTLRVTSTGRGRGTTVTAHLPTIENVEQDEPTAQHVSVAHPDYKRVLLVEDDFDSAQMLAFLLSSEGYAVEVANSVRQAKVLADACDLIVSDIALPDGSGLELMRHLRAERPRRAIALSGYGGGEDIERSLQAGFSEHLTKPVDLDRLIEAVRRLADSD